MMMTRNGNYVFLNINVFCLLLEHHCPRVMTPSVTFSRSFWQTIPWFSYFFLVCDFCCDGNKMFRHPKWWWILLESSVWNTESLRSKHFRVPLRLMHKMKTHSTEGATYVDVNITFSSDRYVKTWQSINVVVCAKMLCLLTNSLLFEESDGKKKMSQTLLVS
jgi:hypothetical protein